MWCVEYLGFVQGKVRREFLTEERARQWAAQCGCGGTVFEKPTQREQEMDSHVTDMDKLIEGLEAAVNRIDGVVHADIIRGMRSVINEWRSYTRQRLVELSERGDEE